MSTRNPAVASVLDVETFAPPLSPSTSRFCYFCGPNFRPYTGTQHTISQYRVKGKKYKEEDTCREGIHRIPKGLTTSTLEQSWQREHGDMIKSVLCTIPNSCKASLSTWMQSPTPRHDHIKSSTIRNPPDIEHCESRRHGSRRPA